MTNQPILSICVPIYNRSMYLDRMLARFLEDKELFQEQIQLYISDNCSTEDVHGVANKYRQLGLNLTYHCNESNLGMDGNFINCFSHAEGKYTWLLGSDDIPQQGLLQELLDILSGNNFGLLHLSNRNQNKIGQLEEFADGNAFVEFLYVWITFISGNIVRSEKINSVSLKKYDGTIISQVPLYLYSLLTSDKNAVYHQDYLEQDNDAQNNGGYRLFEVFVGNLFEIFQEFVDEGLMKKRTLERVKKAEYKNWLLRYIYDILIIRGPKRRNFDTANAWSILFHHYGRYPYFYWYLGVKILKMSAKEIARFMSLNTKK